MRESKVLFLDRDGVLNVDTGYPHGYNGFVPISGTASQLLRLKDRHFRFIIITNQSGIGRGYFTKQDYFDFQKALINYYRRKGIQFLKTYFCPHTKRNRCKCRKPAPGLINEAILEFNLDRGNCYMVGDKEIDLLAGKAAGLKKSFKLNGPNSWASIIQELEV